MFGATFCLQESSVEPKKPSCLLPDRGTRIRGRVLEQARALLGRALVAPPPAPASCGFSLVRALWPRSCPPGLLPWQRSASTPRGQPGMSF